MISLIAAVDKNFIIGRGNELPWGKIPADMKYFRKLTEGHTVVMGKKTFESIGKPLPKRRNIVLSNDQNFHPAGCEVMHSVEEVCELAKKEEIFIIGGGMVYKEFLLYAEKIYLTFIDGDFNGDVYFPLKDFSGWQVVSEESIKPGNDTPCELRFVTFIPK